MEEKILIKSKQYDVKKFFMTISSLSILVELFCIYRFASWGDIMLLGVSFLIVFICFIVIGLLPYYLLKSYELSVTDKRVYGKVAWGKRVDLPVDSISATAMIGLFKGISVSTSSGRISFLLIKNANEIYTVINNLLLERQQMKTNSKTEPVNDETDQLKKYKDLLDNGLITQEEFDFKKKQLLGL